MNSIKHATWFLALLVVGLALFAAFFLSNEVPSFVLALGKGVPWWTTNNIRFGMLALSTAATAIGLIATVLPLLLSKPATHDRLVEMETRILAAVTKGQAANAPAPDAASAAA